MKKLGILLAILFLFAGCNTVISDNTKVEDEETEYQLSFEEESIDDESVTSITLNNEDVYIKKAGTYLLTGQLEDASIIVDVEKEDKVELILANVNIESNDFASIYIAEADKVIITLQEGSNNYLQDSATSYSQIDDNNVDAVIFSKADLVINGNGYLYINSKQHGIVSKDDLIITGGTIDITAKEKGIVGKDRLLIKESNINVEANEDGLVSDNEDDAYRGYVYIESGDINISTKGDGIYGYNLVKIVGGDINIETEQGNNDSTKGIKSTYYLDIEGGNITINSTDDALHSDQDLLINNGTLTISSSDDGIHANENLEINNGTITISKSYEGIEGQFITINGGNIQITASDDGFNAADASSTSTTRMGFGGSTNATLIFNGGYIYVDAKGDGVDSNGTITFNGGTIIVFGPSDNGNAAFDYETGGYANGSETIMIGSSGMAESFSNNSTQCNVLYNLSTTYGQGVEIIIKNGDEILFDITSVRSFNSILFTSSKMAINDTISIIIDGSETSYTLTSTTNTTSSWNSRWQGGGGGQTPGRR